MKYIKSSPRAKWVFRRDTEHIITFLYLFLLFVFGLRIRIVPIVFFLYFYIVFSVFFFFCKKKFLLLLLI